MSKAERWRTGLQVMASVCLLGSRLTLGTAQMQTSGPGMQTGSGAMQNGSHQPGGNAGAPGSLEPDQSPFPDTSRQRRNDERQRRLVSDTQKLVALTSQLRAEVAISGAETMSPEMLKQMEEIEKLAKSVKDKMRD